MSQERLIDGFEFASAGATLRGVVALRELPRLRDLLASESGEIEYEIDGVHDAKGRPALRIRVRGELPLRCQRCLEPVRCPVAEDETLLLAATQAEVDAEPADLQEPDRVLAQRKMPVRQLIEDQLLLAAPYAPRHDGCPTSGAN